MQRLRAMPAPGLDWQKEYAPSRLAEIRQVFLGGCGLPETWTRARHFTIGELGFGAGLTFLATWALWRKTASPGARLHYIAVETSPLLKDELAQCLAQWPEIAPLARDLLRVYPPAQPGFHRLFPAPDVTVTLLYGEAADVLAQCEAEVDAWYLGGFALEKSPEIWDAAVLAEVARLSRPGARFATSAGEMLRAPFRGPAPAARLQPWFARAPAKTPGHAVIIGGGIAGASIVHALERRGWQTTIIDRHGVLADEASGNPAAVLMPRLTSAPNLDGRFYAAAYRFLLAQLDTLNFPFDRCGVLQLAADAQEAERQHAVAAQGPVPEPWLRRVEAAEASQIAGVRLTQSALYFPHSGWIHPRALCAALTAESDLRLGVEAATLEHHGGVWGVLDQRGAEIAQGDIVILANALDATHFTQTAWLPLRARRGQITLAPPTPASASLRTVLSFGGYITPADGGIHNIGATFDNSGASDLRTQDHQRNLDALARALPALGEWDSARVSGRASVRCTTIDHLPAVGPLPAHESYTRDFADLARGHPWARYPAANYQPGLYALTGLASRGMVSAPLAAEVLAAEIAGESWALERDLVTALHPGRFIVRGLKRGL